MSFYSIQMLGIDVSEPAVYEFRGDAVSDCWSSLFFVE